MDAGPFGPFSLIFREFWLVFVLFQGVSAPFSKVLVVFGAFRLISGRFLALFIHSA